MLAYVFWHRPREGVASDAYEQAQLSFHRSLAHSRPTGLRRTALFEIDESPWALHVSDAVRAQAAPAYEDWYLLDDFTSLGILNEAAVGHGHRTAHDEAARRAGAGAGGLYALSEGSRSGSGELAAPLGDANVAIWVDRPLGASHTALGELLGDGMDPRNASLWRRQLVLGPAPEFCLLVRESSVFDEPAGVARTRLPDGWTATVTARRALWYG
ncbi:MAG TPA: hypothetical protein VED41_03830 [Solirubrobacteraceae bacterium]|nr:hypothetical protein [Solirubrobacteraceae bacterium]